MESSAAEKSAAERSALEKQPPEKSAEAKSTELSLQSARLSSSPGKWSAQQAKLWRERRSGRRSEAETEESGRPIALCHRQRLPDLPRS